ncbi:DUF108 domain-containing protein [PVC group bacterium]|nr:DUF108 domain-containing protein [PVC group bacterium]
MQPCKIGIVGCGTIGSALARFISLELGTSAELAGLADFDIQKAKELKKKYSLACRVCLTSELVSLSDFVIEAASIECVKDLLKLCLLENRDVMILSVGGLLENPNLYEQFRKGPKHLYIPSGAISGIDALLAAREGGIESVKITTSKPPRSLIGAPYIEKNKINLDEIKKPAKIFEGSAEDAIRAFPKNINVSAVLSLAGIGSSRTKVEIIADPGIKNNIHNIDVIGPFGEIHTICVNEPDPDNPKTSHLAILSAESMLRKIFSYIIIGS